MGYIIGCALLNMAWIGVQKTYKYADFTQQRYEYKESLKRDGIQTIQMDDVYRFPMSSYEQKTDKKPTLKDILR